MTDHREVDEQGFRMEEFREGVPEVFRDFFLQSYPLFFSFAERLLTDKRSAKNVTVEGLFLLWKKRRDFKREENIRAFLFLTIRNNSLNFLRYQQRHPDAREYILENKFAGALPGTILQEVLDFAEASLSAP